LHELGVREKRQGHERINQKCVHLAIPENPAVLPRAFNNLKIAQVRENPKLDFPERFTKSCRLLVSRGTRIDYPGFLLYPGMGMGP
jgi:hypothetical protein